MGALISIIIVLALLALAAFGIVDEAQRKKRLKEIQAEYEENIRKIHKPAPQAGSINTVDYSTAPPVKVFDYGIDMSGMQAQIRTLEKNMFNSASPVVDSHDATAALHREATRMKVAGDWDGAVSALQKAQELMRNSNVINTTESWVRLPLFLQQAGRFEEAMEEFNRLLNEIDTLKAKESSQFPDKFRLGFTHHPRAVIYDKMRVACKRQKSLEEAANYEVLRDEQREKHEDFRKEFDVWHRMDMARKRAEFEKRYPSLES